MFPNLSCGAKDFPPGALKTSAAPMACEEPKYKCQCLWQYLRLRRPTHEAGTPAPSTIAESAARL